MRDLSVVLCMPKAYNYYSPVFYCLAYVEGKRGVIKYSSKHLSYRWSSHLHKPQFEWKLNVIFCKYWKLVEDHNAFWVTSTPPVLYSLTTNYM